MQEMECALSFALFKAGSSIAARMAMIDITTSNSINVKTLKIRHGFSAFPVFLFFLHIIFRSFHLFFLMIVFE